jgi:hypothetical protein
MKSEQDEPDDAISGAAARFRKRRDEQRAAAEAARKVREDAGEPSMEGTNTRNLLIGAVIIALLAGAGWYMLNQMRCGDRYSSISGFLFHECH